MITKTKHQIPIINLRFFIILYDEPLELSKEFPNVRFDHDPRDFNGGFFDLEDEMYICLLIDKKPKWGVVAHECKHLVNYAFYKIGQKLDEHNDELECYFLTHVVNEVQKVLEKNNLT